MQDTRYRMDATASAPESCILDLESRVLVVSLDLKAIELHRLVRADARLAPGDLDLVLNGVHAFQVGQE